MSHLLGIDPTSRRPGPTPTLAFAARWLRRRLPRKRPCKHQNHPARTSQDTGALCILSVEPLNALPVDRGLSALSNVGGGLTAPPPVTPWAASGPRLLWFFSRRERSYLLAGRGHSKQPGKTTAGLYIPPWVISSFTLRLLNSIRNRGSQVSGSAKAGVLGNVALSSLLYSLISNRTSH